MSNLPDRTCLLMPSIPMPDDTARDRPPACGPDGEVPAVAGRTLPSSALLRGGRSVQIEHNGAVYRLQATRLGKLILTK